MILEQFKKKMKNIPDGPGVYFFLGKNKEVLYIGKATSLRSRVRSYFSPDLIHTRGPVLVKMLEKAASIDWRETDSVLEALILEANLIKTHKPKHNTDLKDDKSWNYVVMTKEDFPRVLLIRGKELSVRDPDEFMQVFGPFPHGLQLREALKIIRKIFPFRDTCIPDSGKRCFNAQIGLCPGVCSGEITKTEYRKIIRRLVMLFQGKKVELVKSLERDMKAAAKAEDFEEAGRLRGQIFALKHIHDVSLIKDEYRSPSTALGAIHNTRIEAYDIAHMSGKDVVGVMVVVEDGQANKDQYRKFKIKTAKGGDDAGSLREVLTRRLGHDEWPLPRILAVDGSTAQMNVAKKVLEEFGMAIPVIGVTKDEKHRPRAIQGEREVIAGRERDILLANAEAHRFAITYHKKLRNPLRGL
ncbi:MAG TPA: UvrB/UvrC motif-containing protein [Candidatus Paceibacterota bacterium]|nr:UvrB/UvrC motif-containing protein [Candidatus Paceibacterota bacterium]